MAPMAICWTSSCRIPPTSATDQYGGSLENRARLMLEVTDAVAEVWGADRVGMHLAPRMDSHDMGDSDRLGTFTYVARELGKRKLGWIAAREAVIDDKQQAGRQPGPSQGAQAIPRQHRPAPERGVRRRLYRQ